MRGDPVTVVHPFCNYELYMIQAQILGYTQQQAEQWARSECNTEPPPNYRNLYGECGFK